MTDAIKEDVDSFTIEDRDAVLACLQSAHDALQRTQVRIALFRMPTAFEVERGARVESAKFCRQALEILERQP